MSNRFGGLDAALGALDDVAPLRKAKKAGPAEKPTMLDRRQTVIDSAVGANRKTASQLFVRPEQCRMWSRHNRIYDLLNPQNCADLIDLIRADRKQKTPAIARRLKDDPDGFEYEIIAGARRHYSVSYLRSEEGMDDLLYFIEVRKLTDEEAFLASDAENRGRKDISDYERAHDYKIALDEYFEGNQSAMATKIGVKRTTLRHYLNLAELPSKVADAFASPTDIALRNASKLSGLISDDEKKRKILAAAATIAKEQKQAKKLGSVAIYDGPTVTKMLAAAAAEETKKRGPKKDVALIKDAKGRALFTIDRGRKYVTVKFEKAQLDDLEPTLDKLRAALLGES